jgi:hypothetical protein
MYTAIFTCSTHTVINLFQQLGQTGLECRAFARVTENDPSKDGSRYWTAIPHVDGGTAINHVGTMEWTVVCRVLCNEYDFQPMRDNHNVVSHSLLKPIDRLSLNVLESIRSSLTTISFIVYKVGSSRNLHNMFATTLQWGFQIQLLLLVTVPRIRLASKF